MKKYHVNSKGEAGLCSADSGNCPFGNDDDHYLTPEAARSAFERLSEMNMTQDPREVSKTYGIGTAANAGYTLAGYTTQRLEKSTTKLRGVALERVQEELKKRGFEPVQAGKSKDNSKPARNTSGFIWKDPESPEEFSQMIMATVPHPGASKIIAPPAKVENNGGASHFIGAYANGSNSGGERIYVGQTEAAANIRSAIKEAKAAGELPSWVSVSVNKNSGAWVTSISVEIGMRRKMDGKVRSMPTDWLYEPDKTNPEERYYPRIEYTEAGKRLNGYVQALSSQWENSFSNPYADEFRSSNAPRVSWRDAYKDK